MKSVEEMPPSKALMPLNRDHALLDPSQKSDMAENAAHDLMAEGKSDTPVWRTGPPYAYWAA